MRLGSLLVSEVLDQLTIWVDLQFATHNLRPPTTEKRNARRKELTKANSGYNLGGSAAWRALSFSRNERETQRINKKPIPVTILAALRLGVLFLSPRFCLCLGWFSIFFLVVFTHWHHH